MEGWRKKHVPCSGLNSCLAACRTKPLIAMITSENSVEVFCVDGCGLISTSLRTLYWTDGGPATSARWSGDDRVLVIATRRKIMAFHFEGDGSSCSGNVPLHFHARDVDVIRVEDAQRQSYLVAVSGADGVQVLSLRSDSGIKYEWALETCLHRGYLMCKNNFSRDGKLLAVACVDGHLAIWKVVSTYPTLKVELNYLTVVPYERVTALEFSEDCLYLAVGCWAGEVLLFKQRTGGTETRKQQWDRMGHHTGIIPQPSTANGPTLIAWSPSASMLAVSDGCSSVQFFSVDTKGNLSLLCQEDVWKTNAPGKDSRGLDKIGMSRRVVEAASVKTIKGFVRSPGLGCHLYCSGHLQPLCSLAWPTPPLGVRPACELSFGCGTASFTFSDGCMTIHCAWNDRMAQRHAMPLANLSAEAFMFMLKTRGKGCKEMNSTGDDSCSKEIVECVYPPPFNESDILLTGRALAMKRGTSVYYRWRKDFQSGWRAILAGGRVEHIAESGKIFCTIDSKKNVKYWGKGQRRSLGQLSLPVDSEVIACLGDDAVTGEQASSPTLDTEEFSLFSFLIKERESLSLLFHAVSPSSQYEALRFPVRTRLAKPFSVELIDCFNGIITLGLVESFRQTSWVLAVDLYSGRCCELPVHDKSTALRLLTSINDSFLFPETL